MLARVADRLEAERVALADQLDKDRRKAAVPSAHSWAVVKAATDLTDADTRMRLRSAIRDVVTGIWCVFAGHKSGRYRGWLNIMLHGGGWREMIVWADNGHSRSKRKPSESMIGGNRGDELAAWMLANEPACTLEPAPLLALEGGAEAAKAFRDEQLALLGQKKADE